MTRTQLNFVYDRSGLTTGRGTLSRFARLVLQPALERLGYPTAELTIMFCSEERIRALNREYRDVDAPTDVLSFPAAEDPAELENESRPYLGDLAISLHYTARSAKEQGRPFDDEVALLLVHGMLHLLGRDHDTKEKEEAMWREQESLLALSRHVQRPSLYLPPPDVA